jgi:hypothetical protein
VAWTPGLDGKSGAVVAMAWMPGFSSQDTIATPRLFALAGAFFQDTRGDEHQGGQRRPFGVQGTGAAFMLLHLRSKDRGGEIGCHD